MGATRYPFLLLDDGDAGHADIGGIVKKFKAAGTLLIGDCVYLSAEDTVTKATGTAAIRRACVGIVVGGSSFTPGERRRIATKSTDVGSTAALINGTVLVLIHGICWAVSDAAITINTPVAQGATTAGRVDDITLDATTTVGEFIGIALDTAGGAAATIKLLVSKF
jgi:hypothetical protein